MNIFSRSLAAGITHERQRLVQLLQAFDQPLAVMQTTLLAAQQQPSVQADAALRGLLDTLARQQAHLQEIVGSARSAVEEPPQAVCLADIVDAACLLMAPHCSARGLATDMDMALAREVRVSGHPLRLRQMVIYLLHHACAAIAARCARDGAGRAGRIIIRLLADAERVHLCIDDNGLNLPEHLAPAADGVPGFDCMREVVHLYGGTLTRQPLPDAAGTQTTVSLPRAQLS